MSFDLGSLGFLTMFPFELFISSVLNLLKFKKDKGYKMLRRDSVSRNLLEEQSLESNDIAKDTVDTKVDEINTSYSHKTEFSVIFRMRLAAVICRKHELSKIIPYIKLNKRHDPITECTQDAERKDYGFPFDVSLLENTPVNILNDIVIDRGPTPFVCEIEIYVDEIFLTLLRADGLVLATATGSTAYSLSAGGSLMHPSLSAMILTPICPHTVSFRPIVLPASASIRVCVPHRSRTDCWACFDGKNRVCINKGDSIIISASNHPLPTINRFGITADWFRKIENCLGWNRYYPKNYRPANFARPEDICDVNITQCDREEPENCRPPPE